MADKDVDEQFAAIMAHWHEDALGLDPHGDPSASDADADTLTGTATDTATPPVSEGDADVATRRPQDGRPVDAGTADRPADDTSPEASTPSGEPAVLPPPPPPLTAARAAGLGWRDYVPETDPEDEHFVPPPPAPLPSADDKHFWLMMVGLIAGPLLFLYLLVFNRDGNEWWMACGIGMTVAGFVLLVLRQPLERDEDDDGVRL